jgi:hypothetical protein
MSSVQVHYARVAALVSLPSVLQTGWLVWLIWFHKAEKVDTAVPIPDQLATAVKELELDEMHYTTIMNRC